MKHNINNQGSFGNHQSVQVLEAKGLHQDGHCDVRRHDDVDQNNTCVVYK